MNTSSKARNLIQIATVALVVGGSSFVYASAQSLATTTDELASTSTSALEHLVMPTSTEMALVSTSTDQTIASSTGETAGLASEDVASTSVAVLAQNQVIDPVRVGHSYALDNILQTVADREQRYFAKHGRYLQILEDQQLPEYEDRSEDVSQKLGIGVPSGISVNVYEGPTGKGFQVVYRDKSGVLALGVGPDAASLTYTYEVSIADASVASSTPKTADVGVASSTEQAVMDTVGASSTADTASETQTATTSIETIIDTASTTTNESPIDMTPVVPTSTDQIGPLSE